jgi:uncharacterized protein (DUF1330 family)
MRSPRGLLGTIVLLKTNLRMAFAAWVGILVGAAITQATSAQQVKAPAYVIAEVEKDPTKPEDPAAARRYAEEAPKSLIPFGGKYVVRGGAVQTVEGEAPKGYIVVIAFDSMEKARGWNSSPAYEAIKPIRQNSMKSRILIVEGVPPQPDRSKGF